MVNTNINSWLERQEGKQVHVLKAKEEKERTGVMSTHSLCPQDTKIILTT